MNKVCFGCGCVLQSVNDKNPGYIPLNKIKESNYCKRCFRLTHYGEVSNNDLEKSTMHILDNINKDSIFKIFIVDFLNLNNNTIELFNKIKGRKLLLISKVDLLNKSINKDKVISRIKKIYKLECDVRFISGVSDYGINSLMNYLQCKNINKTYLVGPSNSGKSTLVNKIISIYKPRLNKLTISNKRNTTLEFIRVCIDDITFIDSPGFLLEDYNLKSKYKNIIKPITYNMKAGEILLIDKFYIKFSKATSITLYTYDLIKTKKWFKEVFFEYDLDVEDNVDLCINGLGLLNIKKSNNISIGELDKNLISVRNSIFGDIHE